MKNFYLREVDGEARWCVKEKGKFRLINDEERQELQDRIDYAADQIPRAIIPEGVSETKS